ncbi:MAG: FtsX-like permease family protein, partial [Clostridiales bacterium]|nr:FtsX-like permease family protein [Clostridiales bacterium]
TIRRLSEVEDAAPIMMYYTNAELRENKSGAVLWGVDSGADQVISLKLMYGRLISRADVAEGEKVCMVDQSYAKEAYGRENIVGKEIRILVKGTYQTFRIIGIVEAGSNLLQNVISNYIPSFVYVPYTTLQQLSGQQKLDQIAVRVQSDSDVEAVEAGVIRALNLSNGTTGSYKAENLAQQRDKLTSLLDIVTLILTAIGGISLIVAGLGIMTVMLASVGERTREIGVKKAIGAKRRIILAEFILEALLISLFGSVLGVGTGLLAAYTGGWIFGVPMNLGADLILTPVLFAVAVGVLFGAYPAYKAAKLRPVDALRSE